MIAVTESPRNKSHFERLISFTQDVLAICDDIDIQPVLSGSLALFAYTQNPSIEVHDVDLSCSELHFSRLCEALTGRGIDNKVRSWHVLQAVKDDLKVEFDASEHWMVDIPAVYETLRIGNIECQMVSFQNLRELYRRGLVGTASNADDANQCKNAVIRGKLHLLENLER